MKPTAAEGTQGIQHTLPVLSLMMMPHFWPQGIQTAEILICSNCHQSDFETYCFGTFSVTITKYLKLTHLKERFILAVYWVWDT